MKEVLHCHGPEIRYSRVHDMPPEVRAFCHSNDAWVVGSGACWLLGLTDSPPPDWDVLVPLHEWNKASRTPPKGTPTNSQGGLKWVTDGGVEIDVWGDDLSRFLKGVPGGRAYAVNPSSMTWLMSGKETRRKE